MGGEGRTPCLMKKFFVVLVKVWVSLAGSLFCLVVEISVFLLLSLVLWLWSGSLIPINYQFRSLLQNLIEFFPVWGEREGGEGVHHFHLLLGQSLHHFHQKNLPSFLPTEFFKKKKEKNFFIFEK